MIPKFRAWHKKEKVMFTIDTMTFRTDDTPFKIWSAKMWACDEDGLLVNYDAILMQSTCLTDENGKEIFEGDIVRVEGRTEYYYMRFKEFGWYLSHCKYKDWSIEMQRNNEWVYEQKFEIIGNIHSNPELLKEKI